MKQLSEETIINEIQATVAQARQAYQATELANAETRDQAAKGYLEVLDKAVTDGDAWDEVVDQKVEQLPTGRASSKGRLPITHPNPNDPRYRLLLEKRPFLIELRRERDDLKDWLDRNRN